MNARSLVSLIGALGAAALLGACNGNDCRSEADLDGFARFSQYATQINACYLQSDCIPLCEQLFQLTPDEKLVACDIGKPRTDGIRVRARVEFHDVCAPDWGYTVGDDDDWDDGTDDGSYGGGYDDGGYSEDGGYDDGTDDGSSGDGGYDDGSDSGDDGGDGGYTGDDGGDTGGDTGDTGDDAGDTGDDGGDSGGDDGGGDDGWRVVHEPNGEVHATRVSTTALKR